MTNEFDLVSQVGQFFFYLCVSCLVLWFAKRRSFFSFPFWGEKVVNPPTLLVVLGGGAIYFFGGVVASVAALQFFRVYDVEASILRVSWVSFLSSLVVGVFLLVYMRLIPRDTLRSIWGRMCGWGDVLIAAGAWLISFPVVVCVSQLLIVVVYVVFGSYELPDQVAIKLMKLSFSRPMCFVINALSVAVLAPFIEEFLFRGLVQNYLKRYLGMGVAIAVTSLLFAFLHYSGQQKLGNVPLLGSLFVFSGFLGFVYERQRSLWAPMFLHAAFNVLSVVGLYFFESA